MILSIKVFAALLLFLFTFSARASALVTVPDNETVTSSGFGIYALSSDITSKDTIVGSNVAVTVSGANASSTNWVAGLYSSGAGASIDAADNLQVNTRGDYVRGILVDRGGVIEIGDSADITTSGLYAQGVFARIGSKITIGSSADIATFGNLAHGALAGQNSSIAIGDFVTVNTSAPQGYGFYSRYGSSIDVGDSATFISTARNSPGVMAFNKSSVAIGDSMTFTTRDYDSYGVHADLDSYVSVGDAAVITTSGANSHGVYALTGSSVDIGDFSAITTSGSGASGLHANQSADIRIGDDAAISTSGQSAYGVGAWEDASVNIGGSAAIGTTGDSAHAVYSRARSLVQLNGTKLSATGPGASAVRAENDSRVAGNGRFDITGNITADVTDVLGNTGTFATVDLTMTDGSQFTGATALGGDGAEINLTMEGAASKWNVTKDSTLTSLTMNGSEVDFSDSALGTTVTMETLSGTGGSFTMHTDTSTGLSDRLVVTGTSSGSYTITMVNNADAETDGTETLTLVETADSGASFAVADEFELGAWVYSTTPLHSEGGSGFQITGSAPVDDASAGEVNVLQAYSTGLSNAASAAVNAIASGYLMGYAEMSTMSQRLGELRDTPYMSGFWARVHGGGFNTDRMRLGEENDLEYGGVLVGYDRKIETGLPGDLHAGVMFGYGKGDIDFAYADGEGNVDTKTIGVYGAYKQDDGLYVDAVLKYQWMEHGFETFDSTDTRVTTNDVESGGLGLSLEAGKRFELGNGWFVEPQAQLSYQRQDGGVFNMSNGLSLSSDGWTSLQGRLGARAGYDSGTHGFYAKVSWVKEFDGDFGFEANGEPFADSFGDSWWVYGVGYTAKLNDRNSIYIDVERSSGGAFEQDWAIKAGWRIVL